MMSSTQSPKKNLLAQSDPQTLLRIRHTCAHVLAMAVLGVCKFARLS